MPSLLITTLAASAFMPLRIVQPVHARLQPTRASMRDTLPGTSRARTAVLARPRAPAPLAFDGGFEGLADAELRMLLRARGVVVPDDAVRNELLDLFQASGARLDDAVLGARDEVLKPRSQPFAFELSPMEAQRVDAFERVAPAVAYIQTSVLSSSPFQLRPTEQRAGAGSGFVWDDAGHVITNYHVVAGGPLGMMRRGGGTTERDLPRKVTCKLPGQDQELEATVIGVEPDKDLAVLKIDPAALEHVTPLAAASSAALRVGQSVLAIGNPFGLDWTLTQGIVSALGRDIDGAGGRPIRECIQTDAAINPGNSGGPLLDSSGRLIGVNTMIYSPGGLGANVGIGFAVPVDTVKRVVTQIIERGPNARPSIGVSVLPDQLRVQYGRNLNRELDGAMVAEVVPGSPADQKLAPCERRGAGVLLGDMITAVNGTSVANNEDLLCLIEVAEPDQPLSLTVMRGSDPKRLEEVMLTPVPRKELEAPR